MSDKLRFSRFVHLVPIEDYVAVYNAANLAVIFISTGDLKEFQSFERGNTVHDFLSSLDIEHQAEWEKTLGQLQQWQILVPDSNDDMALVRHVQKSLEHLPIGVLYLLLTDVCNFACRYCFIEGKLPTTHPFSLMTAETARRGVDLFVDALKTNEHVDDLEPNIIFYGGEPLVNWKVMELTLEYIASLKGNGMLPSKTRITLNTNASLITKKIAHALANHHVTAAVSIDGNRTLHDAARPFRSGSGTFRAVMRGVQCLRDTGASWAVSCTISEFNLNEVENVMQWLSEEIGVKGLGFNIWRETDPRKTHDPVAFAEEASKALIRCYEIAREKGIYEDRIMRKVKAFVKGQPLLNDCAGCGQQLVVAPSGEVGVCHGFYSNKKYFTTPTTDFDPQVHPIWTEWRKRSPFNMPQCYDCIALGICGGGCPQQAFEQHATIWEVDRPFCVHSKLTLDYLLRDLLKQVKRTNSENAKTV